MRRCCPDRYEWTQWMAVIRMVYGPLPDLVEHLFLDIEPGQNIMGMDINVLVLLFFSGPADAFCEALGNCTWVSIHTSEGLSPGMHSILIFIHGGIRFPEH